METSKYQVLTVLMLLTGVSWTVAYLLMIRQGFRDKTYPMPIAPLCVNITWEFIFSFVFPFNGIVLPINITWFGLDCVMAFQLFRYAPKEFPDIPRGKLYALLALGLGLAFSATTAFTIEANDYLGLYSGFAAALLAAMCYVPFLYHRRSLRGQSMSIALAMFAGAVLPAIGYLFFSPEYESSVILRVLYGGTIVFSLIYIGMVRHYE